MRARKVLMLLVRDLMKKLIAPRNERRRASDTLAKLTRRLERKAEHAMACRVAALHVDPVLAQEVFVRL